MYINLLQKSVMSKRKKKKKNVNDGDFDTNINRDMCMKGMFIFIGI